MVPLVFIGLLCFSTVIGLQTEIHGDESQMLWETEIKGPSNEDCKNVSLTLTNNLKEGMDFAGLWISHKSSKSQLEASFSAGKVTSGSTSRPLTVNSFSGDYDWWSFAGTGADSDGVWILYHMAKRCLLYCPKDNDSTVRMEVSCENTDCLSAALTIKMNSGTCKQSVAFQKPKFAPQLTDAVSSEIRELLIPTLRKNEQNDSPPNSDCQGIKMRFVNEYPNPIFGVWFLHRSSSNRGEYGVLEVMLPYSYSEVINISSSSHDYDEWSFAALGYNEKGPFITWAFEKSVTLICPRDDNTLTDISILEEIKDIFEIKMTIDVQSGGNYFWAQLERPT